MYFINQFSALVNWQYWWLGCLSTRSSPLRRYWSIELNFSLSRRCCSSFSLFTSRSRLLLFAVWVSVRLSHGITRPVQQGQNWRIVSYMLNMLWKSTWDWDVYKCTGKQASQGSCTVLIPVFSFEDIICESLSMLESRVSL